VPPAPSPHDKLFRLALADNRAVFAELRAVLPTTLAERLEPDSLEQLPGSFLDESLRASSSDLLFSARLAGEPALVYFLFEHKSEVDRTALLQLLRYMLRIWEKHGLSASSYLPPILPILVHHSNTGWTTSTRFESLFAPEVLPLLGAHLPSFEVLLDDLSHKDDAELRARMLTAFATLAFFFLRDGRRGDLVVTNLPSWGDLLQQLFDGPGGQRALLQLLSYISSVVPDLAPEKVSESLERALPERTNIMSTLAEKWLEEGELKGKEKGRREVVKRQLCLKFGGLAKAVEEKLDQAKDAELDLFAERVLTATTLEQIFDN